MSHVTVLGATGRVGGATARALLAAGRSVRAVTRDPASKPALRLQEAGAQVWQADMDDERTLPSAFEGSAAVFNVQQAFDKRGRYSHARELAQGLAVAAAAARAAVPYVVYSAAGTGLPTGIPHFDAKIEIADAFRERSIPLTVVNPAPFMELLCDASFAPALSTWGVEPRVVGWDTPLPWIATRDVGRLAAALLAAPAEFGGRVLTVAADRASLNEAKACYREIAGRGPRGFPLPVWMFRRMIGRELPDMWRYLRDNADLRDVDFDLVPTLAPGAFGIGDFLEDAFRRPGQPFTG